MGMTQDEKSGLAQIDVQFDGIISIPKMEITKRSPVKNTKGDRVLILWVFITLGCPSPVEVIGELGGFQLPCLYNSIFGLD